MLVRGAQLVLGMDAELRPDRFHIRGRKADMFRQEFNRLGRPQIAQETNRIKSSEGKIPVVRPRLDGGHKRGDVLASFDLKQFVTLLPLIDVG